MVNYVSGIHSGFIATARWESHQCAVYCSAEALRLGAAAVMEDPVAPVRAQRSPAGHYKGKLGVVCEHL